MGWSLRVCLSSQFPGDANSGPTSTLVVANFLALRIQHKEYKGPCPWGVSSWARSVLDPNKGGEVEVRGTQSLRKSAGRECRGCLTKLPHFRDWKLRPSVEKGASLHNTACCASFGARLFDSYSLELAESLGRL